MKSFYYIILILFTALPFKATAQLDVFADEVTHKDNKLYYNNELFTGTLYSIDENVINNTCQCSLKAIYKEGKLNGIKKEWFNNGKLKFEGEFDQNSPINTHKYYNDAEVLVKSVFYKDSNSVFKTLFYKNGNKKSESNFRNELKHGLSKSYTINGSLDNEVEYNEGKIIRNVFYKENKKTQEEKFDKTRKTVTLFYKDETIKSIKNYSITNKKPDGKWEEYNAKGVLVLLTIYLNGKIKSNETYKLNKKDGTCFYFTTDFKEKTIETYQNGNLITTKHINTANFIKNFAKEKNDQIVSYFDEFSKTKSYYILRFNNDNKDLNTKRIIQKLKQLIYKRVKHLKTINSSEENNELVYIIEINNISTKYKSSSYKRSRVENGKTIEYYENGYEAIVNYTILIKDLNNDIINSTSYSINKQGKLGTSLLNSIAATYAKDKPSAFNKSLKAIEVNNLYINFFPIKSSIKKVEKETSSKIIKVVINKGYTNNVKKKMRFVVLDKTNNILKSELKVISVFSNYSICKVMSDSKWLKEYINSNTIIRIVEYN